jgi:hypothetical protein
VKNTLAYYSSELITVVKSFITVDPVATVVKIIFRISCAALSKNLVESLGYTSNSCINKAVKCIITLGTMSINIINIIITKAYFGVIYYTIGILP